MAGGSSATGAAAAHVQDAYRDRAVELFFDDRKLYDIAAHSAGEQWPSARAHEERMKALLEEIVRKGAKRGEFERKTPLDETCGRSCSSMQPLPESAAAAVQPGSAAEDGAGANRQPGSAEPGALNLMQRFVTIDIFGH